MTVPTCCQNLVKIGQVVIEISRGQKRYGRTDGRTDVRTDVLTHRTKHWRVARPCYVASFIIGYETLNRIFVVHKCL